MNNSILKTASLFIAALLFIGISTHGRAAEREECAICGMYLDSYARTRLEISFVDGTTRSTCGLACASEVINLNRSRIKGVRVADFLTSKLFDADKAYFLEGSDVPGVMTYTSRLAFSSKAQALTFQKEHGGRIITFDQALTDQLKDKE